MSCSSWACSFIACAALLAGCQNRLDPAPSGAAPVPASRVTSANAAMLTPIGPEPGPNEPSATIDNPLGGNDVALQEGHELFLRYNCVGCHGDHGGGGMGPSLRDVTWRYGNSAAAIFSSISQGRAQGMPAWGTKIPAEQVWKLVAYIQSMRKPVEPAPPNTFIPPPPMPW
jgi:cytochrome c oxidase cbb3-type subunit 3